MLFNEPKLLKFSPKAARVLEALAGFSALQRAEIAEIVRRGGFRQHKPGFSALQRAEIAEIQRGTANDPDRPSFSALQRAEIAEMLALGLANVGGSAKFQCSSTSRNC